jgi:deoxyribodipyrimidine photo-lyase
LHSPSVVVAWFRRDLRLADNPALEHALAVQASVLPLYIHAPEEEAPWEPGAASRWWLHHSLLALEASLQARASRLVVQSGSSLAVLLEVARRCHVRRICCNRLYDPALCSRDEQVAKHLAEQDIELCMHDGGLLLPPANLRTTAGDPYRVFTPFWRALQREIPELPSPRRTGSVKLAAPEQWPQSLTIDHLQLLPKIRWDSSIAAAWQPGEVAAHERLRTFARQQLADYAEGRDRPDLQATSRLSPHLHFGEISPARVLQTIRDVPGHIAARTRYASELAWREFAHHLLAHFPHTTDAPLQPKYAQLRWRRDARALRAWQRGQTGIPIVDAGMRELWQTGFMHNRVRMIAASFLVKNLGIDWRAGARWFWDTLVDADLANNSAGWQWVAGTGADAAPYFRIFNPVLQGKRFDPEGTYVRRFVPELASLGARWIHEPWRAPAAAGVTLGRDYPKPLVDLKVSGRAALERYEEALRSGGIVAG